MPIKGSGHQLKGTPEYCSWVSMRMRCRNPQGHDATYYEGVTICPEWNDPVKFIKDMGQRPSVNHQIDRIDNTKGYFKENCRWVDKTTQMQNTRLSKWWFVNGVRYASLTDASNHVGVTANRIKAWCDGRTDGGYTYPPKHNCWSEKKYANDNL